MKPTTPALERAFELARSGSCRGLDDIRRQMLTEGYSLRQGELWGLGLRRQLKQICQSASAAKPAED